MPEYGDHLRLLVYAVLGLVGLFLFSALLGLEDFTKPVLCSILILMLFVFLLARFGGDFGRTQ